MNRSQVKRIRRLIKESGLSQNKFALAHGFSTSHFGQILTGVRTPSIAVALKFKTLFDVPLTEWPNLRETVQELAQLRRTEAQQAAGRAEVADRGLELTGTGRR